MGCELDKIGALLLQLTVPIWDVLVSDTRCDVEHDDATLSVDVVTISKATKFLLPSRVPDIELDSTKVLSNV